MVGNAVPDYLQLHADLEIQEAMTGVFSKQGQCSDLNKQAY